MVYSNNISVTATNNETQKILIFCREGYDYTCITSLKTISLATITNNHYHTQLIEIDLYIIDSNTTKYNFTILTTMSIFSKYPSRYH